MVAQSSVGARFSITAACFVFGVQAHTKGPSRVIPCAVLEPFVRFWSQKVDEIVSQLTFDRGSKGLAWSAITAACLSVGVQALRQPI